MTAAKPQRFAGAFPMWTPEEDARLLKKLRGRTGLGQDFWIRLADQFPQRSFHAIRQRYLTLRMQEAGIKRERHPRPRTTKAHQTPRTKPEPKIVRPPTPHHVNLTAFLCGDPLPGRSALDEKRSRA